MTIIAINAGTQTAELTTEHVLASGIDPGRYTLIVDVSEMDEVDRIVLRAYQKVASDQASRQVYAHEFVGAQINKALVSPELINEMNDSTAVTFSLTQTTGEARDFAWKVLRDADVAVEPIFQARVDIIDDNANGVDRYVVCLFKDGRGYHDGDVTGPTLQVWDKDGVDLVPSDTMTEAGGSGTTGTYFYEASGAMRMVDGAAYVAYVAAEIDGISMEWFQVIGRDSS